MSRSTIPIFLLLITLAASVLTAAAASRYIHHPNPFLHNSCRSTRYPVLCETSLGVYAPAVNHSPRQLAHAALSVSAAHAAAASSFVHRLTAGSKTTKSRSSVAVSDCIETLSDSVDRLKQSAKEMVKMGRWGTPRFKFHVSNAQTWASAALTDLNTCMESLAQDKKSVNVRAQIRKRIIAVSQITSNALALVNRLQ